MCIYIYTYICIHVYLLYMIMNQLDIDIFQVAFSSAAPAPSLRNRLWARIPGRHGGNAKHRVDIDCLEGLIQWKFKICGDNQLVFLISQDSRWILKWTTNAKKGFKLVFVSCFFVSWCFHGKNEARVGILPNRVKTTGLIYVWSFSEKHTHTHTAEIEIEMNLEMNIYENSIVNNNLIQKTCMIPPLSDTTILWDSRKNRIQLIIEAMRKAQVWSAMEDVRWFLLPCQIFDQPG